MVVLPLTTIPPLITAEPHIWRCSLELDAHSLSEAAAVLAPSEQARAARFHFARHRNAFIAARGQLRMILGAYLDLAPAALEFAYGTHGKPLLEPCRHLTTLCFNLAHTEHWMVLAVTESQAVGVDCETIVAERDLAMIARSVFSRTEQAEWSSLDGDAAILAFYRCWTRKEAYIKAHGLGLSMALDSFDVSLDAEARLLATRPDPEVRTRWSMATVAMQTGLVGAIVVEGALRQLWYVY